MTDQTPEDWVLLEGAKKCGWDYFNDVRTMYGANAAFRALCDMIAKHEQKPVDRKLLCAREAMATQVCSVVDAEEYRSGKRDNGIAVQDYIRAIELWEEGFGK